jgi:hypothetical protein
MNSAGINAFFSQKEWNGPNVDFIVIYCISIIYEYFFNPDIKNMTFLYCFFDIGHSCFYFAALFGSFPIN